MNPLLSILDHFRIQKLTTIGSWNMYLQLF